MPTPSSFLKELRGTTLGKLLAGPRDPRLEPIYSALAIVVSLYFVYKIPILFLISYSSMHRFYPYDLIEHWGNSGLGIAFTLVFVLAYGSLCCVALAPIFIQEYQRLKQRRRALPYLIWAVVVLPIAYLIVSRWKGPYELLVVLFFIAVATCAFGKAA